MSDSLQPSPSLLRVNAGEDRFGEHRGLVMSTIDFKVSAQDSGGLFVLENTFQAKGGPPRHLHVDQEEWFYLVEGEFIFEVGEEKFRLKPGDSLLAPRNVPHVWAYAGGGTRGKILVSFMPAGKMEAFFRDVMKTNAPLTKDPAIWREYGMELLGPPLPVE